MKKKAIAFVQANKGLLLLGLMFLVGAFPTFASSLPGDSFGWINTLKGWIIGPLGASLGTIGIFGAGIIIAVTQGRGIGVLFWVLVGFGIVFGAPNLMQLLFPNAGTSGFLLS